MRTCAFCLEAAKLSAEHILGRWMNKLFHGRGKIKYVDGRGNQWEKVATEFDWTAKVVCRACNNTWMSAIEQKHAEPVLTALIEGKEVVPISASRARSLAIFTFKTAVVLDYAHKASNESFFSSRIRTAFRQHLTIPNYTNMWMAGFQGNRAKVALHSAHYSGQLTPTQPISMYVFTCALGHLVLQLAHVKAFGVFQFEPREGLEMMVRFWPDVPKNLTWPFPANLTTKEEFVALENCWQNIASDY